MPFIPHTDDDVRKMLDAIGAPSIETLFDEIPVHLRGNALAGLICGFVGIALVIALTLVYVRIKPCIDNYEINSSGYNQCVRDRL